MKRSYKRSSIYKRYYNYYRNALLRTGAADHIGIPKRITKREYERIKARWEKYRKEYQRRTGLRPKASGEFVDAQGRAVDVSTGEILDYTWKQHADDLIRNFLELLNRLDERFRDLSHYGGKAFKQAANGARAGISNIKRLCLSSNKYALALALSGDEDFAGELSRVSELPYGEWYMEIQVAYTSLESRIATYNGEFANV